MPITVGIVDDQRMLTDALAAYFGQIGERTGRVQGFTTARAACLL
jgi:hypothetical protein